MNVGFLIPRYGAEALGGAELAARALAEHLADRPGVTCEVFTTCARDAATWADELAPGTTIEGGVTVHRFRSRHGRRADFAAHNARLLAGVRLDVTEAEQWLESLGPVCPDAVDAAAASDCDVVTVHPYLYHPCVTGVLALRHRAVLHPATHDEPPIHLPFYGDVFAAAGGLAFWTATEQRLAARLFPDVVSHHQTVVGFGVDAAPPGGELPAALTGRPYVLCLGKVLAAKGSVALARWFATYKDRHPGPIALVFAGTVVDAIPETRVRDDVVMLGPVDEPTKTALLRECQLLVSPSPYESLSLVVLEAWAAGRPVLVNGACDVTRDHAARYGAGLWFVDYATFEAALERLLTDTALADHLGAAGLAAIERDFTWTDVVDRYLAFLGARAGARS